MKKYHVIVVNGVREGWIIEATRYEFSSTINCWTFYNDKDVIVGIFPLKYTIIIPLLRKAE